MLIADNVAIEDWNRPALVRIPSCHRYFMYKKFEYLRYDVRLDVAMFQKIPGAQSIPNFLATLLRPIKICNNS